MQNDKAQMQPMAIRVYICAIKPGTQFTVTFNPNITLLQIVTFRQTYKLQRIELSKESLAIIDKIMDALGDNLHRSLEMLPQFHNNLTFTVKALSGWVRDTFYTDFADYIHDIHILNWS